MCVCVCLSVCLSNLRYPKRDVVSPRRLHHLEELHLASCTNCFSSLYDTPFERKSHWKFFASYARYLEREVISPRCFHHLEELRLASCTNFFRAYMKHCSREKAFGSYSPVTHLIPVHVHAPLHFRLPWAGGILPTT